jgi:hypothetical protein
MCRVIIVVDKRLLHLLIIDDPEQFVNNDNVHSAHLREVKSQIREFRTIPGVAGRLRDYQE